MKSYRQRCSLLPNVKCRGYSTDRKGIGRAHPLMARCGKRRSIGLHAGELHHLAPFLGFFGQELAEISGRADKWRPVKVS